MPGTAFRNAPAEKAAQQDRDVHGTKGAADLWDLAGQEGQCQAKRQADSRRGQAADRKSLGIVFHIRSPFRYLPS